MTSKSSRLRSCATLSMESRRKIERHGNGRMRPRVLASRPRIPLKATAIGKGAMTLWQSGIFVGCCEIYSLANRGG